MNRSCPAWLTPDEAMLLKGVEHAVNAGRGTKETFHIALGWRFAMNNGVGINECQVLALFMGKGHRH